MSRSGAPVARRDRRPELERGPVVVGRTERDDDRPRPQWAAGVDEQRHVARRVLEHRAGVALQRGGAGVHEQKVDVLPGGQSRHVLARGRRRERRGPRGDPVVAQRLRAQRQRARLGAHLAGGNHARDDQLVWRLGARKDRRQPQQRVERGRGAREHEQ